MLVFIDESGNFRSFDPSLNNFGERFVSLSAVIIEEANYTSFKSNLNAIKSTFSKYIGTMEIKSHSIRRSRPDSIDTSDKDIYDFYKYGDEGKKDYFRFTNEVKQLVIDSNFQIISVNADKVVTQGLYPHKDLLTTMLTDLWERLFICLHLNNPNRSRIFFDPQLNVIDDVIETSYKDFRRMGSRFIKQEEIAKVNLYKRCFSPSSSESMGIQLADYVAYPIKRHIESRKYDFFDKVIKAKLHPMVKDTSSGKYIEMGLKMTLSR